MNITKESIDELNGVLKVNITKADYESSVKSILNDYRKKANIPGFRPGKVPASLIQKRYGTAVLVDEVNKILSKEISKYIIDEKLDLLGEPLPDEERQTTIDWEKDEDFEFIFDIAVSPIVKVSLDKRNKFPYYNINIDEDLINQQIEAYSNRYGESKEASIVAEKSTLKGTIEQQTEENPIKVNDVMIATDLIADEEIRKQFVGAAKETAIIFDIKKAFPKNEEIAHMLKIEKDKAEKLEGNFSYTINDIHDFTPSEVNEDLFKKVYGENVVSTLDEFKNKIKEDLSSNLSKSSDYRFLIDTRDTLVEKYQFDLPVAFLKRWLKATNKELTDEQIESDFIHFEKDLKWQIIKNAIASDHEIKVSEEDLQDMAKEATIAQFHQYGIFNIPEEYVENYSKQLLEKEEERRQLFQRKEEEKVLTCVKEKVTLDFKTISQDEFNKLFEKDSK